MIIHRKGDLFASGLPALAHGVNCQGLMGAGIAAGFAGRWPDMCLAYQRICANENLDLGGVFTWEEPGGPVIFNLASQFYPGADARPWALAMALARMTQLAYKRGIGEVGMPMIGCGIGGLSPEWLDIILKPYENAPVDLTVFEYVPEKAP